MRSGETAGVKPTKVLYILATQRGGSTITGRVIGSRPGFAMGGEIRRLWSRGIAPDRTCGCGERFDMCPFWSPVLERVLADGRTAAQVTEWQSRAVPRAHSWRYAGRVARAGRAGITTDPSLEAYRAAMGRLYGAMAEALDARVLVDASKLPADAAVLLGIEGVEPYVLHLVRDPRGVVHSQLRRRWRTEGLHRWRVLQLSFAWITRHLAAQRLARQPGFAGWLRLRYEDLVADPANAITQIERLVGETSAEAVPEVFDLCEVHTAGGRLPAERGVCLHEDVRWRTELPRLETVATTALTLPWLRRFGYRVAFESTPQPFGGPDATGAP